MIVFVCSRRILGKIKINMLGICKEANCFDRSDCWPIHFRFVDPADFIELLTVKKNLRLFILMLNSRKLFLFIF